MYMGLKESGSLALPKVRKAKRLPRMKSQDKVARLIHRCDLYDKALLATIYDCSLRVSKACSLRWDDINFDRQQLFIYQSKVMTMNIVDFLNLLSQHILPDKFVRIRHYGFLSPCNREMLRCIQQLLNVPPVSALLFVDKSTVHLCAILAMFVSLLTSLEIWISTLIYIIAR